MLTCIRPSRKNAEADMGTCFLHMQRGPPPGGKRPCAGHASYHRRVRGRTPAGHGPLQPARVILLFVLFLILKQIVV